MIAPNIIWIFSLAAFALIALTIFVVIVLNSRRMDPKFSFLRTFPYEFINERGNEIILFKPLLYILTGLAFSPLFVITPLIKEFGSLGFFSVMISCVFGLAMICNCLLFFFDARYTKTHMVLFTISSCLVFLSNTLTTIYSFVIFKGYKDMASDHLGSLILGIASGVIAIAVLFLIVNPKLKNWAKLEVETDGDQKTYKRGKVFILAFTEWLILLLSVVGEIIFFLTLIK